MPGIEKEEALRARRRARPQPSEAESADHPADLAAEVALLADHSVPAPASLGRSVDALLDLQQAQGNLAVQRLLTTPPGEGSGQPVEPAMRAEMEAAFGRDFGDVRVHADAGAASLARAVGAAAFTLGKDIYFAEGAYDAESPRGRETLGHELAHVVQQTPADAEGQRAVSRPDDSAEREAEAIGVRIGDLDGARPLPPLTAMPEAALQRQSQADTAAAAAPPDLSPAMRILWEDSVVRRIREAHEALARRPRRVRVAAERVREAGNVVESLTGQYAGQPAKESVRLRLIVFMNLLAYYHLALMARLNEEQVDVPDVRDFLDPEGEEMREWLTRLPALL